uniref:Uncharacterized protein n=1 Tax=Candidatus Kentrum sp. TC TaxID=2126339 RepID=A0A450ZFZ2_9GAMM|nr:MAG: hypothetical protein BECKTC1821D_GA0114238_12032 [Candidatus Kentron sp. TC]VFK65284.1 MAG: hypothetical protein BECKTC1821F_GA0114240_11762 [Candidatus Kentron sp. TC]
MIRGVILGGGEGVLNEGDAVGAGLEGAFPLLGREVNQEGELFEHGVEGVLDAFTSAGESDAPIFR